MHNVQTVEAGVYHQANFNKHSTLTFNCIAVSHDSFRYPVVTFWHFKGERSTK